MNGTPQREKFKDALHYVAARAGARPDFGATKLYKVLWFSEARTFVLNGAPMFGVEFVRQRHGPVPKDAMRIREELVAEGRLKIWKESWSNFSQWHFKSITPPDSSRLSALDIDTLNYWTRHIDEDHTATSISDQSHDYGWEIARMGETLPVHAFLAERLRDPTEAELVAARRRMGLLGL